MVDFSLEFAARDTRARVFSIQELANALGCSESLVKHMLKEQGNPGRNPNGSYELDKWNAFFAGRDNSLRLEADSFRRLSAREREAKAALAELRLEKERGALVEVSIVEKSALEAAGKIKAVHFRSACVDFVSRVASVLALDRGKTGRLLEEARAFHESFCQQVCDAFAQSSDS